MPQLLTECSTHDYWAWNSLLLWWMIQISSDPDCTLSSWNVDPMWGEDTVTNVLPMWAMDARLVWDITWLCLCKLRGSIILFVNYWDWSLHLRWYFIVILSIANTLTQWILNTVLHLSSILSQDSSRSIYKIIKHTHNHIIQIVVLNAFTKFYQLRKTDAMRKIWF
jgi:hypothetical protein